MLGWRPGTCPKHPIRRTTFGGAGVSRKRGNGEGNVRKRPDGRWEARYVVEHQGGVTRRSVYGRTYEEAARQLREAIRGRDDGLPPVTGRETLGGYLTDWLAGSKSNMRPQTLRAYERNIRLHITPILGRYRLRQLQPADLQRLYQDRLDAGLSPTTVRHIHAVLSRALGQATQWNLIARNPASLVKAPRRARHEMRALTASQVRTLLAAARSDRLEALYVVAVTTGMRQGELLALRWRDVDLDRSTLSVTGTLQWSKGVGLTISEPKTARSRRQLQLASAAVEGLRQHRARQAAEILASEGWDQTTDLVFPNHVGRPMQASNLLRRSFFPLLAAADLPHIRFHDLRHTAATLLLSRGVHPKIASEMLGHSTVAFTLDVYSHVTETLQREAARTMDSILGEAFPQPVGVSAGVNRPSKPVALPSPSSISNTDSRWARQDSNLRPEGYEPPALTG
jgi:integrase